MRKITGLVEELKRTGCTEVMSKNIPDLFWLTRLFSDSESPTKMTA